MFCLLIFPFCVWSKGIVTYQYFARINDPEIETLTDHFFHYNAYFDTVRKTRQRTYLDAHLRFFPGGSDPIFSVPEVFISYHGKNNQLILGRKIVDWNPTEKFWGLGKVNGLRAMNLLEQDQEGVTGLHYHAKMGDFDVQLLASYFHIPQINPTFHIDDGNVEAPTEWSKEPPERARFEGEEIPVFYKLQHIDFDDLLLKPSVGIYAAYNWRGFSEDNQGKVTGYYAYKPEQGVRINATGFFDQQNDSQAVVTAKPFSNLHQVYGLGVEQKIGAIDYRLGWDVSDPDRGTDPNFEFDALKVEPKYFRESYVNFRGL